MSGNAALHTPSSSSPIPHQQSGHILPTLDITHTDLNARDSPNLSEKTAYESGGVEDVSNYEAAQLSLERMASQEVIPLADDTANIDEPSAEDIESSPAAGAIPPQGESDNSSKKLEDQTNLLPRKQLIVVFSGLSCALFCSLLDQTIIGRDFNQATISSWVGTAYLLTSTACQPMYGRLSDIFGRKVILLASLSFFCLGSILSAVSKSMIMLILCRCLAGLGGGGVLTTVMIITSDVVSLKERGIYQSISGVVVAASNSLGPLIGGAVTEKLSWRWCFYIDIPLASASILVVAFLLPIKRVKGNIRSKLCKIDYLGCAVMTASAVLILIPISWRVLLMGGTTYPWLSAGVLAPLIIGVVLVGVFIWIEIKVASLPLIPMHIFKNSTVAGANFGAFLTGFMFYVNLYYLPQFYQVVRGDTALQSGIYLLPLILTQTVTSFTAGFLVSKTGNYRVNLWFGFAIWAVGQGLLSTISPNISQAKLVGYQILSGVGAGQTFQTSLVAIQAAVKRNEMAVATGTRNFLRLLGGTIALAAASAILNNSVKSGLRKEGFDASIISSVLANPTQLGSLGLSDSNKELVITVYTSGLQRIYYFMIPCCVLAFFATLLFVKPHSLKREDDAKLKAEGKTWAAENTRGRTKG